MTCDSAACMEQGKQRAAMLDEEALVRFAACYDGRCRIIVEAVSACYVDDQDTPRDCALSDEELLTLPQGD